MGMRDWISSLRERNQSNAYARFRSATGFYSFEYPRSCRVSADGDVLALELGVQAINVSATKGEVPDGFPRELLANTFAAETPTSKLNELKGAGWHGLRQDYVDHSTSPQTYWSAVVAHNRAGYVLVTWNARGDRRPDAHGLEHLVETLRLSDAAAP